MILGWLKLTLLLAMSGVLLGMLVSAIVSVFWKAHIKIDDPALKAKLALLLSSMPLLSGGLLLAGAFGPSVLHLFGVVADHCGSHGDHHPFHLCFLHGNSIELGYWVWIGSALLSARVLLHWSKVWRKTAKTRGLSQTLLRLSNHDEQDNVWYIESARAFAFTIGFLSPRVCISTQLVKELDAEQLQVVIAHEHQHARSRDGLRLLLIELFAPLLLPQTHQFLAAEFELSREQLCDEAAAETKDRLLVAETILAFGRLQKKEPQPSFALAFGQCEIEERVHSLLEHPPRAGARYVFISALLGASLLFLSTHTHIHHAMEALLGNLH